MFEITDKSFSLCVYGRKLEEEITISSQLWAPGVLRANYVVYQYEFCVKAGLSLPEGLTDPLP